MDTPWGAFLNISFITETSLRCSKSNGKIGISVLCNLFNHSKRLCNVRFTSVQAKLDLTQVKLSAASGDFNAASLSHVVNTETMNQLVVQSWLDRAGNVLNVALYNLICLPLLKLHGSLP